MSNIQKNPSDSVDLLLHLMAAGAVLATFYPQAHVYDPNNNEITGSPFTLTALANDIYLLRNAFQAESTGTYLVKYIVYTDSGHTTKSDDHGETMDTIEVSLQSSTGLGGGSDVIVDLDVVERLLKEISKKVGVNASSIKKINKEIDAGFKIKIPEVKPILDVVNSVKESVVALQSSGSSFEIKEALVKSMAKIMANDQKFADKLIKLSKSGIENKNKLMVAIKKNRTTVIKSRFEKALMLPIIDSHASLAADVNKRTKEMRRDFIKMTDINSKKIADGVAKELSANNDRMLGLLNTLNESVRKKLKYTLTVIQGIMSSKSNMNITLKK